MQCGDIIISDSLYRLIQHEAENSVCLKIVNRALRRLMFGRRTRLLNMANLPGNFFSFREKSGMISFCPKGKRQLINDDGTWARDCRQSCRPGKWLRSILHPRVAARIQDHLYAEFATIVKHEELRGKLAFKLVSVGEAYSSENFVEGIESCMWDDPVGPFYNLFPAKALVAINNDGEWMGRAIVWSRVKVGDTLRHPDLFEDGPREVTFMDRIYALNEETAFGMAEYASSQGWWRKRSQNNDPEGAFITPNGKGVNARLTVIGKDTNGLDFYPYLDTMAYGGADWVSNQDDDAIYDYQEDSGGGDRHLIGEGKDDHEGEVQTVDGNWANQDDVVDVDGNYYLIDDSRIVRCYRLDEYILLSEAYEVQLGRNETVFIHERFVSYQG